MTATLGIVGGIGPESTVIYYRTIVREYRRLTSESSSASIIVNSIDNNKLLSLASGNKLDQLAEYLSFELARLVHAGATVALLAANTPHLVFPQVQKSSPIPLISIVECTCRAAKKLGLTRLGLFGTRYTMTGHFYADFFRENAIALVVPSRTEQEYIHRKYMTELLVGRVRDDTRNALLRIAEDLVTRSDIDGLVLGGTELSLLFEGHGNSAKPVPFLDTTEIHARAAAEFLVKQ